MAAHTNSPYELLLRFLRGEDVGTLPISQTEWESLLRTANEHGVRPLLKQRLSNLHPSIPAEVEQQISRATIAVGLRNTKLYHELAQVLTKLNDKGVDVIVLKGGHLAELVYENVSLRPMDDVDILVHKEDLRKVEQSLFDLGYVHLQQNQSVISPHHLPPFFKEGGIALEVHWLLPPSEPFKIDMDGVWRRSLQTMISGVPVRVLNPEDLLLHLCLHASVHHRFGIGLRPLCDIAKVISHFRSKMNWDVVRQRSKQWGASNAAYVTLRVAMELLGAEVPQEELEKLRRRDTDHRVIEWAKSQVFARSRELMDNTSISPRLAGFWEGTIPEKVRLLLRAAFPSRDELGRIYGVPSQSARIFFYYPIRMKDIITTRGEAAFRLARKDKDARDAAWMFNQLIDNR